MFVFDFGFVQNIFASRVIIHTILILWVHVAMIMACRSSCIPALVAPFLGSMQRRDPWQWVFFAWLSIHCTILHESRITDRVTHWCWFLLLGPVQAIPRFSSLDCKLRSTLLDLILGRRFLRNRWFSHDTIEDESLSLSCRWLSIVQNRSCSDIYNDVSYPSG